MVLATEWEKEPEPVPEEKMTGRVYPDHVNEKEGHSQRKGNGKWEPGRMIEI